MVDLLVQLTWNSGLEMNKKGSKLESKKKIGSTASLDCNVESLNIFGVFSDVVEVLIISQEDKQGLYDFALTRGV